MNSSIVEFKGNDPIPVMFPCHFWCLAVFKILRDSTSIDMKRMAELEFSAVVFTPFVNFLKQAQNSSRNVLNITVKQAIIVYLQQQKLNQLQFKDNPTGLVFTGICRFIHLWHTLCKSHVKLGKKIWRGHIIQREKQNRQEAHHEMRQRTWTFLRRHRTRTTK